MSDAVLDRGVYFPSPMIDWYRQRPFKVAFAVSVVIHALLIALIPGLRSIPIETPRVLDVDIVPAQDQPIPPMQEKLEALPKIVEPKVVPIPEPVMRQPRPEPTPEPKIEPLPAPPPVARVEPRPEPRVTPSVDPRPEPRPEPRTEIRPEPQPLSRESPPPVAQPRVEPVVAEPAVARPDPAPVATAPAPPVVAPQPQASVPKIDEAHENRLLVTYGQSISKEIKRYQRYPAPALRRGWEGTAEVLLQIAVDGKVTGITLGKSSGHVILDEEALEMVRRASPLPQAPADFRGRALVVSVPIVFRLQNS
jgi:protein TonB